MRYSYLVFNVGFRLIYKKYSISEHEFLVHQEVDPNNKLLLTFRNVLEAVLSTGLFFHQDDYAIWSNTVQQPFYELILLLL